MQVEDVAMVLRGQGSGQAHLLACNQTFHRRHSNLSPSSVYGSSDQRDLCVVLWNMHEGGVNKLETKVQILELF